MKANDVRRSERRVMGMSSKMPFTRPRPTDDGLARARRVPDRYHRRLAAAAAPGVPCLVVLLAGGGGRREGRPAGMGGGGRGREPGRGISGNGGEQNTRKQVGKGKHICKENKPVDLEPPVSLTGGLFLRRDHKTRGMVEKRQPR